jgi:hypothetical protein
MYKLGGAYEVSLPEKESVGAHRSKLQRETSEIGESMRQKGLVPHSMTTAAEAEIAVFAVDMT